MIQRAYDLTNSDLSSPQKKAVVALKGVVYLTAIDMKESTVGSPPFSNDWLFTSSKTSSWYPWINSPTVFWILNP